MDTWDEGALLLSPALGMGRWLQELLQPGHGPGAQPPARLSQPSVDARWHQGLPGGHNPWQRQCQEHGTAMPAHPAVLCHATLSTALAAHGTAGQRQAMPVPTVPCQAAPNRTPPRRDGCAKPRGAVGGRGGRAPSCPPRGGAAGGPPAQGPIPTPAAPCAWAPASWGCLGRRLGTAPEQPAAEPPQPLPSRPDRQGRRQPPLKLGAGQCRPPGTPAPPKSCAPPPSSPYPPCGAHRCAPCAVPQVPAEVGASGLGAIKPSGRWEPTGSDSPR